MKSFLATIACGVFSGFFTGFAVLILITGVNFLAVSGLVISFFGLVVAAYAIDGYPIKGD